MTSFEEEAYKHTISQLKEENERLRLELIQITKMVNKKFRRK